MTWIRPGKEIEIEVEGLNISFLPVGRRERVEMETVLEDDGAVNWMIAIFDFVEKHVIKIDDVEDALEFIEVQPGRMVVKLYNAIMLHGTISKDAAENLDLPSESSQPASPTATVENAEKDDVSTNQESSKQREKAKLN